MQRRQVELLPILVHRLNGGHFARSLSHHKTDRARAPTDQSLREPASYECTTDFMIARCDRFSRRSIIELKATSILEKLLDAPTR